MNFNKILKIGAALLVVAVYSIAVFSNTLVGAGAAMGIAFILFLQWVTK